MLERWFVAAVDATRARVKPVNLVDSCDDLPMYSWPSSRKFLKLDGVRRGVLENTNIVNADFSIVNVDSLPGEATIGAGEKRQAPIPVGPFVRSGNEGSLVKKHRVTNGVKRWY